MISAQQQQSTEKLASDIAALIRESIGVVEDDKIAQDAILLAYHHLFGSRKMAELLQGVLQSASCLLS